MPRQAPSPIEIPSKDWESSATLAACRARDANALLRLAHRNGVTNERLSYWTSIDPGEISKRLNNKNTRPVQTLDRWQRIADGLTMPDHARVLIGLAPRHPDSPLADRPGEVTGYPPMHQLGEDVNRREVMKLMAASTLAAVPVVKDEAFRQALLTTSDRIPLDHFRRLREMLAESDNLYGPARVIPAAREQVALILELKSETKGSDLRTLLSVGTEYADLIAWLHQDSGQLQAASWWLDRALEWSHLAMDDQATSFILTRKGQLAADQGDGIGVISATDAAARHANTRVAAIAAAQSMRGYATLGDLKSFDLAHEKAHALLSRTEDDGLPWGKFFDASYIEVHYAQGQVALGDFQGAVQTYTSALARMPRQFHRDRGVYLARAAFAHVGAQEIDEAVQSGMESLAIAASTKSVRILRELRQVNKALGEPSRQTGANRFKNAFVIVEQHSERWPISGEHADHER